MAAAPRSRARFAAALVAIALLALLLLWRLTRAPDHARDDDAARAAVATAAAQPTTTAGPAPAMAPVDPAVHPDYGPAAVPEIPIGPDSPPQFPPGSQPLTEGTDPALSVSEDDPVDSDHPQAMHAVFGARRDVVHPPDPLVFDLKVTDDKGNRLVVKNAYAKFRSEKASPETGPWFRAEFADDGNGADLRAGDRNYTLTYYPSAAEREQLIGFRLFVEVGFDAPNGLGPRKYGGSIMYTELPHGHLNGSYTEAVENGSLVVGAGVSIDAPGRFKVIASLYSGDGQQALVFAQNSVQLDAGERSIPLTFFGKILHDAGVDGPYQLRYMMLFEEHPDKGVYEPGTTVDPAYTTRAYKAASFSPAPYVPPVSNEVQVTASSPSQRNKPPPLYGDPDRARGSVGGPPTTPLNSTPAPDQGSGGGGAPGGPNGPSAPAPH
jgi:hypothetical protein